MTIYTAFYGYHPVVPTMFAWGNGDTVMGIRTVSAHMAPLKRQVIGDTAEKPPS
ncbi:MAG: hypothetical protein IIC28_08500 [Chloroflexi bacterium]|nr:hypothetical protein [Chloroflexota bacterium]